MTRHQSTDRSSCGVGGDGGSEDVQSGSGAGVLKRTSPRFPISGLTKALKNQPRSSCGRGGDGGSEDVQAGERAAEEDRCWSSSWLCDGGEWVGVGY